MKRWMCLLVSVMLILTACASAPAATTAPAETTVPEITTVPVETTVPEVATMPVETTIPAQTYDLVYDMGNYDFFAWIFDEKPVEEWDAMGRYTILLEGLHTPVVVNMDGTSVVSITAYDHTVELGDAGLANDYNDGYSPVDYISSTQDAVVIRINCGESHDDSILISADGVFPFQEESDHETNFYIREDGTLEYRRVWNDPIGYEQEGCSSLWRCTDRDELLSETGSAEFVDGELVLTVEQTVVLSDLFDLEAMFAEAQANDMFTEYETLDDLLAANREEFSEE